MASPAVRSLLGKSKLPLPLLIRGTALTSRQSKTDVVTALVNEPIFCSPKEVVPPPQSSVCIGNKFLLGGGKAWALGRFDGVSGDEGGLRLSGHRPVVKDEDDEGEEAEEDEIDDDGDDYLKDLGDSEDFDDDDDDFEEEEEEDDDDVPRRKSKGDDSFFMYGSS